VKSIFYNVRIGISPINWVNDNMHDIGDRISFEQIVDEMSTLGFEGTELGRKYPRDPAVLREALKKRNLVLSSGWCDVLFIDETTVEQYIERITNHAKFLKEMGCRHVICCEVGNSTNWDPREDRTTPGVKKLDDAGFKMLANGLNRAGRIVKDIGMELVYHVHSGTVIETQEETRKLMSLCDQSLVHLLADTGHLKYCDVDIESFFAEFASKILYVHLKDVRSDILKQVRKYNMDFNSAARIGVFTVPGDGCIDFVPIMEILAKSDYQGWMVVEAEQNPDYANPYEYAKKTREYLRRITGLPIGHI
jgi:inosose dehydratase